MNEIAFLIILYIIYSTSKAYLILHVTFCNGSLTLNVNFITYVTDVQLTWAIKRTRGSSTSNKFESLQLIGV